MYATTLLHRFAAVAIFALVMLLPGRTAVLAQTPNPKPSVMLILDASRSMWGQIDGVNKIVSARTVSSRIAKEYEGKLDLGLVAYGHRQSSGCDDIEVVLDADSHDASAFAKRVNEITPKGSTPIAASLVKAAEAVRYREQPASLVLIADGADNCKADPCVAASELRRNGKDLNIHVIAFDSEQGNAISGLRCVAENSGGTFVSAASEIELSDALKVAFDAVMTPQVPKIPATADAATAAAPEPVQKSDPLTTASITQTAQAQQPATKQDKSPPADSSAGAGVEVPVTLSARTVEGGSIIKSGLVWWIYKNARTNDGKYQLIDTYRDATPTAALPPGSYRIAAAYGKVNLIKDIDVTRGKALQEIFILNAGGLRLNAVTHDGKTIPPNSVRYDLFADESETDQFGNRKIILRDAQPGVVLRLNGGAYHVVSTYGDANAVVRADVAVEAGRLTDATINHSAAKVTLKLVTKPGGEALADTQWNILTPGGDIVKESAGALPTHILASGNYSVLARYQGKNYTREFMVEPGEVKQIEVVIQ